MVTTLLVKAKIKMLLTEPSMIRKITWLSIRNMLVKYHGIREKIADIIVEKYRTAIERAAKQERDAVFYTESLVERIKEKSTTEEFEKLLNKKWRPPCSKCNGVQVVNIDDSSIVECDNCNDGTEPVDIFAE